MSDCNLHATRCSAPYSVSNADKNISESGGAVAVHEREAEKKSLRGSFGA